MCTTHKIKNFVAQCYKNSSWPIIYPQWYHICMHDCSHWHLLWNMQLFVMGGCVGWWFQGKTEGLVALGSLPVLHILLHWERLRVTVMVRAAATAGNTRRQTAGWVCYMWLSEPVIYSNHELYAQVNDNLRFTCGVGLHLWPAGCCSTAADT